MNAMHRGFFSDQVTKWEFIGDWVTEKSRLGETQQYFFILEMQDVVTCTLTIVFNCKICSGLLRAEWLLPRNDGTPGSLNT